MNYSKFKRQNVRFFSLLWTFYIDHTLSNNLPIVIKAVAAVSHFGRAANHFLLAGVAAVAGVAGVAGVAAVAAVAAAAAIAAVAAVAAVAGVALVAAITGLNWPVTLAINTNAQRKRTAEEERTILLRFTSDSVAHQTLTAN